MNLPTKLSDVIMQNKSEILALLDEYTKNDLNLLFIGSNNTFKSRIITLLVEDYYSKCISLPMYPTLLEDEQKYVIKKIEEYYE